MKKQELIEKLREAQQNLLKVVENIDIENFNLKKNDKWSPAEHIGHLINSVKPLNKVFILPKFMLKIITGTPNRSSRTYNQLVDKYLEKLKTSNPTTNPFGPNKLGAFKKKNLLDIFEKEYNNFVNKIEKNWTDESLENYLIPHPLLGKLTVREMIMFTIYHTFHHQKAIEN